MAQFTGDENSPRICFITGHKFGYQALRGILNSSAYKSHRIEIRLVLALDKKKEQQTVGYIDLAGFLERSSLPYQIIESSKTRDVREMISKCDPDYLLVIGLSELVPPEILDIPKIKHKTEKRHGSSFGCVGMHPTLLPVGRGRAPIPWAILKGLTKTGVTAFLLEDEPDKGGILLQEVIELNVSETATTLFAKCEIAHYNLGLRLAAQMAERQLTWVEQDENLATYWPRRRKKDGRIDFNIPAEYIDRLVRALTPPYPGAYFEYDSKTIIVTSVSLQTGKDRYKPGTIVNVNRKGLPVIASQTQLIKFIEIACTDGTLLPIFKVGTEVE